MNNIENLKANLPKFAHNLKSPIGREVSESEKISGVEFVKELYRDENRRTLPKEVVFAAINNKL